MSKVLGPVSEFIPVFEKWLPLGCVLEIGENRIIGRKPFALVLIQICRCQLSLVTRLGALGVQRLGGSSPGLQGAALRRWEPHRPNRAQP